MSPGARPDRYTREVSEEPSPVEAFLAVCPQTRPDEVAALEAALAGALGEARQAWPEVDLSARDFAVALAERCEAGLSPLIALERLHTGDVYLAVACAAGDATALDHFERVHMSLLPLILAKVSRHPDFLEECGQLLRKRLLVSDGGRPRVHTYSGRGPLAGWFRAAALRLALNLRRAERIRPLEVELSGLESPRVNNADSELERGRHQAEFRVSLRAALVQLTPFDKMLLRWHFLEALPLSRIAELQGVSKSTVSRWISSARERVLALTRADLQDRLGVATGELSTLVRVLLEGASGALTALLSRAE